MNAMIRPLKGMLAVMALAGLGLGLRWTTTGTYGAANSHDLDSMAVLAVGTVGWMAYGWLVLAVLATVLEQLPGAIGSVASALAGRITSRTSHALLRSALGVAAVTPLTVSVAHAASPDAPSWRSTEPRSSVLTGSSATAGPPHSSGARTGASTRAAQPDGSRVRVGVPDRPTAGAPTRYTDLRSGQPVRLAGRVVVKPGDTLWSIAAAELGPNADHAAVANRWPAWYAANRQLIGPDPDLILPGQVLRTPAAAPGHPVPPTHQEK